MKNIFLILFGTAILGGDVLSRQFFLASLKYFLYVTSTTCMCLLEILPRFTNDDVYDDVMFIYTTLPHVAVSHFMTYSELYFICGYLMLMLGFTRTLMSCMK